MKYLQRNRISIQFGGRHSLRIVVLVAKTVLSIARRECNMSIRIDRFNANLNYLQSKVLQISNLFSDFFFRNIYFSDINITGFITARVWLIRR